jgi:hypothetical protein
MQAVEARREWRTRTLALLEQPDPTSEATGSRPTAWMPLLFVLLACPFVAVAAWFLATLSGMLV